MTQTRPEESPDMTTGSGLLYPMMYFCTWIQHGSLHLGATQWKFVPPSLRLIIKASHDP